MDDEIRAELEPEELLVDELQEEYHSGDRDEAIERAENVGIDIDELEEI